MVSAYCGSITVLSREIMYYIINKSHTKHDPFNKFPGIPVMNGVVVIDFETGNEEIIPYSPDQKFSYKLPVAYNRLVPTKFALDLLRTWVYEKDMDTLIQIPAQTLLQKMCLYTYKKFYLINGARDSGKSSYNNFLTMTLSVQDEDDPKCSCGCTKNYTSISLGKLINNQFAKAGLKDKLLNRHNDMTQFYFESTGAFKELIGDVYGHNTEKKHQDAQEDAITAVHVFTCNQLPFVAKQVLQDDDFWPKMEYIYFPFHYRKDDSWESRNLTEDNCSSFFNFILDMMKRIKKEHHLIVDTEGSQTLEHFLTDSEPIMRFIKLNMIESKDIVYYDRRSFMIAYARYCRDKKIKDMEEFENIDDEILIKALDILNDPDGLKKLLNISGIFEEDFRDKDEIGRVIKWNESGLSILY